jgi:hypothetical protein
MDSNQHTPSANAVASTKRFNIYSNIHKALRAFMCDTLSSIARMDGDDQQEVDETLGQLRDLADVFAGHLEHENEHIHTALEAREHGSSQETSKDHEHHRWAIEQLRSLGNAVKESIGDERVAAINQLRAYLALFVAENLTHMNVEETDNNAVLWATHTDAELMSIEQAIVSSVAPEEMGIVMRWMIPALNHSERTQLLNGMRDHAPQPVFEGVLAIARTRLTARDWHKLARSLALPERLAA